MKYRLITNRILLPLGIAASTLILGAVSARAESPEPTISSLPNSKETAALIATTPQTTPSLTVETSKLDLSTAIAQASTTDQTELPNQGSQSQMNQEPQAVPVPGTAATTADTFFVTPNPTTTVDTQTESGQAPSEGVAQIPPIEPGRATRSGPSYLGVGLNVGATGDTPLGDTSFAVLSKIGLTRNISIRPSILVSGDVTFVIPVTLDFPTTGIDEIGFAPFVGIGGAFSTGDDENADLVLTGGVDIPLTREFVATASANFGVLGGVDIGILLGIGYTFAGF